MSELLDLQDDLARAVMWLAEHWSADLPVPCSRGFGSKEARVELSAYCLADDDLTRATVALDVPLADDPEPDRYGNRYRRAVRRFGRVELTVFRGIRPSCDECGTEMLGETCPTCRERRDARRVDLGAA